MILKPQDIVVALKLLPHRRTGRPPFSQIALELKLSPSEVHAAVKRAQAAHIIQSDPSGGCPNAKALEEFLIHGVRYAFYAVRGEPTRGVPTAYAAPPLDGLVLSGDEPPLVWPFPEGDTRGISFQPLYRTVPFAALQDRFLYECLALVDALRDGRVRERKIAERELSKRLRRQ